MKYNKVAAFVVDAQKGFTPLCPDELPILDGDLIAPALLSMMEVCDLVVGSKDAHPDNAVWIADEKRPMLTPIDLPNADVTWNKHCVVGTTGFELLDGLPDPMAFDYFVWKGIEPHVHPYGACYHDLKNSMTTGVIEYLRDQGADTVIVGGLAYDFCVGTTALQLKHAGFNVYVYEPATRGISESGIDDMNARFKSMGIKVIDTLDYF